MENSHYASLAIHGQDQVLTIPCEFALSSTEVVLRKEGNRLIVEPLPSSPLLSLLRTLPDIADDFPDVDQDLQPLDDIQLNPA